MQTQTEINNGMINSQLVQVFAVSQQAQKLAEEYETRKSLLKALSDNQCFGDAILILTNTIPHQKRLQWAFQCVRRNLEAKNQIPLDPAEKWLNEPNEENRANILPSATIGQPTAAMWLAMATFWSGGCISETGTTESAPDDLINDTIYSSVMLSVREVKQNRQQHAYCEAINQGIELLDV